MLDVTRLDEARLDPSLAPVVLDGLERLAGVAEMELVGEGLPDPRLRAASPSVPVLVDERADADLDARAAREFDNMLDVPERTQDDDVLGSVDLERNPT